MYHLPIKKVPNVVALFLDNHIIPKYEPKSLAKFGALFKSLHITTTVSNMIEDPAALSKYGLDFYMTDSYINADLLKQDVLKTLQANGGEVKTTMYDFDKEDVDAFFALAQQHCEAHDG